MLLVTGASGFVGKNILELLEKRGVEYIGVSSKEYDLRESEQVRRMFKEIKPDSVIHLAAYVGGILANRERPAEFFYDNAAINVHTIHEAHKFGVKKFLTLIGGCSYPKNSPTPISEENMWEGYPDFNSAPYSLAKRMVLVQCESYKRQYGFNCGVLIPGNIYGPYDNYSLTNSHVIPALIRKFYEAKKKREKSIICWGSGKPVRDFIYIKDVAKCVLDTFFDNNKFDWKDGINISSGVGISIKELVETISKHMKFKGEIIWDKTKPDGHMVKTFDVKKMKTILKFEPKYDLDSGLKETILWYEKNVEKKGAVRL